MGKRQPRVRLSRTHTTYIPVAYEFREVARLLPDVTAVSAGIIKAGLSAAPIRVKIADESGVILLKVRGPTSIQEVRVYSRDIQATKLALARAVRDRGYRLAFKNNDEPQH